MFPKCQRFFIKFNHRMEIVGTSTTDQQIMDRSDEVSLDINEIATTLRDQFKTNKVFSRACCIYRVPARLRGSNEKAYTPRVVSIGPVHHGKKNLKAMEDHKLMYLQQFLERREVSLEDLINVVKDNETELRDCYAETIDLSRKDFARMVLLDAVFVITVLLYLYYDKSGTRESGSGDHKFFRPWELFDVMWDMCLLENQLPFFILEELLERYSAAGAIPRNYTVIELTYLMLQRIMDEWVNEDSWKRIKCSSEVQHFVDFIRKCQQPTERSCEERETAILSAPTATERSCEERETAILSAPISTERSCEERETTILSPLISTEGRRVMKKSAKLRRAAISRAPISANLRQAAISRAPISANLRQAAILSVPTSTEPSCEEIQTSAPTATELHQSGVTFTKSGSKSLFDVRFINGTLEIPQLTIHDRTEILFRNLQAFEQCHCMSEDKFVSDYITFISCLVRAPNDVEVLARNENLKNMLNTVEAVSQLVYNLDKENVVSEKSILGGVCQELTEHCKKPWHKWMANLKQVYFNNPWTAISVVAAAFLLALTVIQTVCSILQL